MTMGQRHRRIGGVLVPAGQTVVVTTNPEFAERYSRAAILARARKAKKAKHEWRNTWTPDLQEQMSAELERKDNAHWAKRSSYASSSVLSFDAPGVSTLPPIPKPKRPTYKKTRVKDPIKQAQGALGWGFQRRWEQSMRMKGNKNAEGSTPWNKGKTKDDDERLAHIGAVASWQIAIRNMPKRGRRTT